MPTQNYSAQNFSGPSPDSAGMYACILGTQEPNSSMTRCVVDGKKAHWAMKMPGNIDSVISQSQFLNGIYRALDMVQCHGQRFSDCTFSCGTDRTPTKSKWKLSQTCDIGIKGSSSDIQFVRCTMTDLLLGDHDVYDNPQPTFPWSKGGVNAKVSKIVLDNCVHPSGPNTPIILRILNAEMPTLINTNAVALVYYPSIVKTYFWVAGKWIDSRPPLVA